MKYIGSKARIAQSILPIILSDRSPGQPYYEPFVGGCNTLSLVDGVRFGSDNNRYLIAMWRALIAGWQPPRYVSREQYAAIRDNPTRHAPCLVGYVGFNCSFRAKWWGGYKNVSEHRTNVIRRYQEEAYENVMRQVPALRDVTFRYGDYADQGILPGSIVYCDPPYIRTLGYRFWFNHTRFWAWVRRISEHSTVYVSEYTAPEDFRCVWEGTRLSRLSDNGSAGGNQIRTERLFRLALRRITSTARTL